MGLFSFFQVSAVAEREINTLPGKEKQDLSSVPFELKTHALLSSCEMLSKSDDQPGKNTGKGRGRK